MKLSEELIALRDELKDTAPDTDEAAVKKTEIEKKERQVTEAKRVLKEYNDKHSKDDGTNGTTSESKPKDDKKVDAKPESNNFMSKLFKKPKG